MTRYFHSILESALESYLDLGWGEVARDHRPSVDEAIVLIEWVGCGEPRMPG